jgi:hypothetical protein
LQGWIPGKSGLFTKETISKDFSMGVDIVSTPAGNEDRPFANPGVLRDYFSQGFPMSGSGLWQGSFLLSKTSQKR